MANSATLQATRREELGSRSARKLRRAGQIPVNLLPADGKPAINLSIDEVAFMAARRGHVHLFDLEVGGKLESAVVRELQWDTLGDRILHVDFKRVARDVETEAEVELEFVGHPKSGQANHLVTHITVRTLPALIPDSLEVKVDGLEEGARVRARELVMPEGVKLAVSPDLELVVISAIRIQAPAATPEAAAVVPTTEEAAPAKEGEES